MNGEGGVFDGSGTYGGRVELIWMFFPHPPPPPPPGGGGGGGDRGAPPRREIWGGRGEGGKDRRRLF